MCICVWIEVNLNMEILVVIVTKSKLNFWMHENIKRVNVLAGPKPKSFNWLYVIMSRTRFRVNRHSNSCLNVKELLAQRRRDIWNLSDCNGTRTHNFLVRKRTLNHLAKLAKWLSCVMSTSLYGTFDCIFLPYHVRISEWIHTL